MGLLRFIIPRWSVAYGLLLAFTNPYGLGKGTERVNSFVVAAVAFEEMV